MTIRNKIATTIVFLLVGIPYSLFAQIKIDTTGMPKDSAAQVFQYFLQNQIIPRDTNYIQYYLLEIKPTEEDPWVWYYKSSLTKKQFDSIKRATVGFSKEELKSAYEKLLHSGGDPHYKESVERAFKSNDLMKALLLEYPVLVRLPHDLFTRILKHADSVLDIRFHTKRWNQ